MQLYDTSAGTGAPESTPGDINRCGHFPWIERPNAFRKAIPDFLPTPGP